MAISKVDHTGRVYIPGEIRQAIGIGPNQAVEVKVEGDKIVLERKKGDVAVKRRGLFKLKRSVKDVDVEIGKGSLREATREVREIHRR